MSDHLGHLFRRWHVCRDPALLAEVFDQAAPELLRLALHLSGRIVDAEDLLQVTFLAAMESADRYDDQRPLMPWLSSILTHRAQADRRRATREVDALHWPPEPESSCGDPARTAEQGETSRAVLEALDRLPEPYRQLAILRVRHGLEPADIAHLLGRSPGTVRVQLHRGLKMLRDSLPASIIGIIAVLATAPRGLAAIRTAILSKVGATPVAVTAVGGFLVGKKALVLALTMLAISAAYLAVVRGWADELAPRADPAMGLAARPEAAATSQGEAPESSALSPNRSIVEPGPAETPMILLGRVVDGGTDEPIRLARVTLFPPRRTTLDAIKQRFHSLVKQSPWGSINSSTFEFLDINHDLPFEVRQGGVAHTFFVPPKRGDLSLVEKTTDDDGRFEVAVPQSGGMLVVAADGHSPRTVPARKSGTVTIRLWPPSPLHGRVITDKGKPIAEPVRLRFYCSSGYWDVRTDEQGAFDLEVGAGTVYVSSLTPEWKTTNIGLHPDTGRKWGFAASFRPGSDKPITVVATRFTDTRLHVVERKTGKPIEWIRLATKDQSGFPMHCGRFYAENGYFDLGVIPSESARHSSGGAYLGRRLEGLVWSSGFLPQKFTVERIYSEQAKTVEVSLTPGVTDPTQGFVRVSGQPVAGAVIQLRLVHWLNQNHSKEMQVDRVVTAEDGSFSLTAPAGQYLLEVFAREESMHRPLEVPHAGPLTLDLADICKVTIEVVDEAGNPQADHPVTVSRVSGYSTRGFTGKDGRVTLSPSLAGPHTVMIPFVKTRSSWVAGHTKKIQLQSGEHKTVRFVLTNRPAVCPRLVFVGEEPAQGFLGWRARDFVRRKWVAVGSDGRIPLEIQDGTESLEVSEPGGRRWMFRVPVDAKQEHELEVRWRGLAYCGTLEDERGQPLRNVRVFAVGKSLGAHTTSTVTDMHGYFRLDGLSGTNHTLGFNHRRDSPFREYRESHLGKFLFTPRPPPATSPQALRIRLPRFENGQIAGRQEVTISGIVTEHKNGTPVANAIVSVCSLAPQDDGELQILALSGWKLTDSKGRYTIRVVSAPHFRATFFLRGSAKHTFNWETSGRTQVERNLEIR